MARQRTRKLTDVVLNEISFVGKGDNPEAHVLLLKMKKSGGLKNYPKIMKDEKIQSETLLKWLQDNKTLIGKDENCAETFNEIIQDRDLRERVWELCWTLEDSLGSIMRDDTVTDKTAMISQSIDQFKAAITAITKGDIMTEEEIAALKKAKEEVEAALKEEQNKGAALAKELDVLKAAPAAGETCKTCGQKMPVKKEDEIEKGLPESIRKELEDNRARITKMEEDNLTREYVGKAVEVALIGKADDVGDILKSIAKADPALADKVFNLFKTADARIKEGDLLKEKGEEHGDGAATAYDKIVAKAVELKKTSPELSDAQAFTKVYVTDTELREAYMKERAGK